MPYLLDSDGFYRPPELAAFSWLFAGFGTRTAVLPNAGLATVKQVHSADVIQVEEAGPAGTGDALITNAVGLFLGVKTADCIPILLVDIDQRAVAAVHAGWRGTAQRIAPAAVAAMANAFGTKPEHLRVAIGPGIGECCYEVGPEVAREFPGQGHKRTHLNLSALNKTQLKEKGVPAAGIYEAELCTFCHATEFFSYRREREQAGRMLSIVGTKK